MYRSCFLMGCRSRKSSQVILTAIASAPILPIGVPVLIGVPLAVGVMVVDVVAGALVVGVFPSFSSIASICMQMFNNLFIWVL